MTLDLSAIEAREKAATKGPWTEAKLGPLSDIPAVIHNDPHPDYPEDWVPVCTFEACSQEYEADLDDASFIAHARSDIPALIAEVRRLQATEDALEHVEWSGTPDSLGNGTCPYCGASTLDAGDGPPRQHKERCVVSEALHPGRQSW